MSIWYKFFFPLEKGVGKRVTVEEMAMVVL